MKRFSLAQLAIACAICLPLGITACAPNATNSRYSGPEAGYSGNVSYGTIVGMRPVQVSGGNNIGVGSIGGGLAGGVAGSFIGGDWRSNALAGLAGAAGGALAGRAIEGAVSSSNAIEFIVRPDGGGTRGDIAVVQSNEDGLQVNERVALVAGSKLRIIRAAGAPAAPQDYTPVSSSPARYRKGV